MQFLLVDNPLPTGTGRNKMVGWTSTLGDDFMLPRTLSFDPESNQITTDGKIYVGTISQARLYDGKDNTTGDGVATKEVILENVAYSANTLCLMNLDAGGFSALEIRSYLNKATLAFGYGNPTNPVPNFRGVNYIESWNKTGTPPDLVIAMDGDYGSGFGFYHRLTFEGATGDIHVKNLLKEVSQSPGNCFTFHRNGNVNINSLGYIYPCIRDRSVSGIGIWQAATQAAVIMFGGDQSGKSCIVGLNTSGVKDFIVSHSDASGVGLLVRRQSAENSANPLSSGTDLVSLREDAEVHLAGQGLVLHAPNNTRYRVAVSNAGALTVTAI